MREDIRELGTAVIAEAVTAHTGAGARATP